MTPQHGLSLRMVLCCSTLALFLSSCGRDIAPEIGPVTPASGHGRTQTFRFEASFPGGAGDINDMQFLFAESMAETPDKCWIDITNGVNAITLRTRDDKEWQPAIALGTPGTIGNDKCSVATNQVKVERNGNQLVVTLPVVFTDALKGDMKVWAIASGPTKHSGWQERGSWTLD